MNPQYISHARFSTHRAATQRPFICALAILVAFGDSAITLEVGFWIPDPQNGTQLLTSAINLGIYHAYKQAGIGIPVPQREISIKTSIAELPAGFASPPPAPQSASPARPYDA